MFYPGIGEIKMPQTGYPWLGLDFLYDCFIHATLCLSIWATAQSTIVTMYGPAVALKGAEFDTVLYVADNIRTQRRLVLFIGAGRYHSKDVSRQRLQLLDIFFNTHSHIASLTSIFLATIFNFWAKIPPGVALSTTIVYVIGYVFTVLEGIRCYNVFHPESSTILTKVSGTRHVLHVCAGVVCIRTFTHLCVGVALCDRVCGIIYRDELRIS